MEQTMKWTPPPDRGTVAATDQVHDPVHRPAHYTRGGIETIDFIEAKGLDYHLGNVIKYVTRCSHKGAEVQDLEKARWYLDRAIAKRKEAPDGE